jgi:hypothetical protein
LETQLNRRLPGDHFLLTFTGVKRDALK